MLDLHVKMLAYRVEMGVIPLSPLVAVEWLKKGTRIPDMLDRAVKNMSTM